MDDINFFLSEAMRIRRTIQVYSELFSTKESIDVLTKASLEVSAILKRSMHDEILISLSRLYDSDSYKRGGTTQEYLSQRNLLEKYNESITPQVSELRNQISELWAKVELKHFRNFKLAHNDKKRMTNRELPVKHNVSFDTAKTLVETSVSLMVKLLASVSGGNEVSLHSNINEKYEGKGKLFLTRVCVGTG